jgi:hypothetical protein
MALDLCLCLSPRLAANFTGARILEHGTPALQPMLGTHMPTPGPHSAVATLPGAPLPGLGAPLCSQQQGMAQGPCSKLV